MAKHKTNWYYLIGIAVIVAIINKNKLALFVWDKITQVRINSLHPAIRQQATDFINNLYALGIRARITQGCRSFADQDKDYAQGRNTPGNIITNAKAGQSFHNYCLAFDIAPMDETGAADYEGADWETIGNVGKSLGLTWGGDFHSIKDRPHFENGFGNSVSDLYDKYVNQDFDQNNYINLA